MADPVVTNQADPDNPSVEITSDVAEQQSTETVTLSPEHGEDGGTAATDVEREAREAGWVSQSEWKGDPKRWRDANTYVETRNHVLPLVQKENKSLREKLAAADARLARLEQVEHEREKQREALSIETLKMQRRQAAEEGDQDRVAEIEDKLFDAKVREKLTPPPQQRMNPEVERIWTEYQEDNPWVKDSKMEQVLREKMVLMRQAGSTLIGRELLDEATDRVKREYPEKFGRQTRAAMNESDGFNGHDRGNVRRWSDLRPDVRTTLEQMIADNPGMKRESVLRRCAEDSDPSQYFRK